MKKLKLDVGELCVESFPVHEGEALRGTVAAAATIFGTNGCYTCDASRCIATCPNTCDNSLDYCTCACSDDCSYTCPEPTQATGVCVCITEP
ncbi:MAG TPA: hypothetical protein VF092_22060 [Longimicrobium sp.]